MGWYAGFGARLADTVTPSVPLPQSQSEGLRDPATRLYDCGNWAVSASWTAPKDAVSRIYFARLVRQEPEPEPAAWRADHSLTPPAARPEAAAHAYGSLGHGRLRIVLREPRASHIYFVVCDDASRTDILFQTADTTWQAYNRYEWRPEGLGTQTILCRAVDDSGNLEAPAAGVTVTVSENARGTG